MDEVIIKKPTKVFISHSSRDIAYVKPIVELLEHIGLDDKNMFCSSVRGYGIPLGNHICDYLKEQFQNYDLIVIYVLSENYYSSPICLNEMGAAWVLQSQYRSILLPRFDYRDIEGVIDHMNISIKLDADREELREYLFDLREMLVSESRLKLVPSSHKIWERHRDEFMDKINSIDIYWKQLDQLRNNNRPFEEWVFPLQNLFRINPSSFDVVYMLGAVYSELGDVDNAISYLRKAVKLASNKELCEKANKRLAKLGSI